MGRHLPVLSNILPTGNNVAYLFSSAIITRSIVGVLRVLQNMPSRQKDPKLSQNQKRQAMMERFFVEIIGTVGYMGCLHFGQDAVNMACNAFRKPVSGDILLSKKTQEAVEKSLNSGDFKLAPGARFNAGKLNDLIKETFFSKDPTLQSSGQNADQALQHNLVARSLFEEKLTDKSGKAISFGKADVSTLKQKFLKQYGGVFANKHETERAFGKLLEHTDGVVRLARKNNELATLGIVAGVALSAGVGGTVIQKMCDGPVARGCKKFLETYFKDGGVKPPAAAAAATPQPEPASAPAKAEQPPSRPMTLVSPGPGFPDAVSFPSPAFRPTRRPGMPVGYAPFPYPGRAGYNTSVFPMNGGLG